MAKNMSRAARAVVSGTDTGPAPRQRPRSLYDVLKDGILWLLYLWNVRVEVTGAQNLPLTGGVILAPNHRSYLDVFPVTGPTLLRGDRKPKYMLKKEAFVNRWVTALFLRLGGIPVDRSPGRGGASLGAAVQALRDGDVVACFPQGTIRHDREVGPLKSGAVRMAAEAGVPIVPVGCSGSEQLSTRGQRPKMNRRRVTVQIVVGEPFTVPDVETGRELLAGRLQEVKDAADARVAAAAAAAA